MLTIFYEDAPYAVLYKYDDTQAHPPGPLGELRAPAGRDRTGAVHQHLAGLRRARSGSEGGGDGGGSNTGLIIGVAAAGVAVLAGVGIVRPVPPRGDDDERE